MSFYYCSNHRTPCYLVKLQQLIKCGGMLLIVLYSKCYATMLRQLTCLKGLLANRDHCASATVLSI